MRLIRYKKNPILKPKKEHSWENLAVFNCGACFDGKIIHLLYRAVGKGRWSCLGYAQSKDGINFKRFEKPILKFEPKQKIFPRSKYDFRGIEDPRITKIGDIYYITYIFTSPEWMGSRAYLIKTKDFKKIEELGEILPEIDDRNVVLFPERINGKYVLYHRILPSIWIAYSNNLKKWEGHQIIMTPRKGKWDSYKIGPAGPPIKTEKGWLLFYHGVDEKSTYRLGVALFDLNDPSKLIARQAEPILEPEEYEETWGVTPNVVFSCGAVEKDGKYYIYYGAADTVISLATVKKSEVLDFIKK
jgi:predicted GH43/DUF377 family glycosyl hydrolase